jgi:hypothetical protein
MIMSDDNFWNFKRAVIELIPENADGFLELEPHHLEACIQVAAMYAAIHMEGVDFVAHAIEAYRSAQELLQEPDPDDEPEDRAPLILLSGGKRTDGPRQPC